jgi:arginase family enzyme
MHIRVLDLDGSLLHQQNLLTRCRPVMVFASDWGPGIRLGCSFGRFRRFERALAAQLHAESDTSPSLTFCGSGDFHHVSLALLRRQASPFNLLVLDSHPDWMRAVPFLHCGTWLNHAARLPLVQRIFHAGGAVDFDNYFRWLAPWHLLRSGKITVFPGQRPFEGRTWRAVRHKALRAQPEQWVKREQVEPLLHAFRQDLRRWPLYVSVDKDVLLATQSIVNWDSGHLTLAEVQVVLEGFLEASGGRLAGMDVVGDWSPVRVSGLLRRFLHLTEHPRLTVDPAEANRLNEKTNLALIKTLEAACRVGRPRRSA